MSLRRFDEDDAIDEDRKGGRWLHTFMMILFAVIGAVVAGISAWFSGKSLHSYAVDMGWLVALIFAGWIVQPIYEEHRNRQKAIYRLVSEMHATLSKTQARMSEIENELRRLYAQR